MRIKILYFSGCPNWEPAVARVRTVLAELGRAEVVVQAEDVDQMSHLPSDWAGSPTLLVNGRDPFAAAHGLPSRDVAIDAGCHPIPARDVCRVHGTETGFDGAPSIDQLRTVLTRALPERHTTRGVDCNEPNRD